jgi:putative tryptophan/tyrosine transport system substrate-binding protein
VRRLATHQARINRRRFISALVGGLLAAPLAARAQQAGPAHRIGVLENLEAGANVSNLNAFRQRLSELGYVEGQNLVIEYRSADGRPERFPDLAMELVQLKSDVIVTNGDEAASAARRATRTTPIVMGVALLWNSGNIYSHLVVKETETVASASGVQLQRLDVNRPWDLERAFEAAMLGQVDALIPVDDYLTVTDRVRIVDFAAMSKLPAIYGLREFVDAGGLIAYGTDRRDLFQRSATYIDRILRGTRPADLPVEAPTKFELIVNLKTAKALGLTVPRTILVRADEIIQ